MHLIKSCLEGSLAEWFSFPFVFVQFKFNPFIILPAGLCKLLIMWHLEMICYNFDFLFFERYSRKLTLR